MLSLGHCDGLNNLGELVVQRCYVFQHVCILWVAQKRLQQCPHGIFDCNLNVVDSWLGVFVELLVDPDRIR